MEAVFHGKAAHAGVEPEKGISAVNEMAHWMLGLHGVTDFEKGTTLNAGLVSGGTGANVVPEKASMTVDVRISEPEERERIAAKIEELEAHPSTPGITVEANFFLTCPPMNPTPQTMKLCRLAEKAGREVGLGVHWQSTGGGSDENFTAALGVPRVDGFGALPARFALLLELLGRIPETSFTE